jgi:hypothetical protein
MKLLFSVIYCLLGFGSPFTPPLSTSSGTDIYLHQLTPNAILRFAVYMWICRTTKIKPSAEGFASAHQVHHQRRTVFEEEGDSTVEKDCQFGCLNFSYKSGVVSPVTAYRNKWPSDWQQHWLYHTVTPPALEESHPLATKELPPPFTTHTRRIPPAPKVMNSS